MQLSKKEQYLIEIFIKNGMTLTAQQLANIADISTKTVYRTVKKINQASETGDIIVSEIGKGLSLDYDKYLKESINKKGGDDLTEPLERRNNIMLTLLYKAPNKVQIEELFSAYYVSDTVIGNDISKMNEFLLGFNLQLHRGNKRLNITGLEKNIRKAVNELINNNNLLADDLEIKKSVADSYDLNYITSILEFIEKKLDSSIAYPYNTNIFSHLFILLKRSREGTMHIDAADEQLDEEEKKLIEANQGLYDLARTVIEKISSYLNTKLSTIEQFYLFQYLISSRLENNDSWKGAAIEEAGKIADFYDEKLSKTLDVDLKNDFYRNDLLNHIEPFIYRIKNEIAVKNELLPDIVLEYPEIFAQVKKVSQEAEEIFGLKTISDDEIGFLTLYFVKFKEMQKRKRRVLIMCSSGVGTSELLKVKVKKAFSDIEIVDVLSSRKFKNNLEDYKNIDLILTTIHLSEDITIPNILVNSVFTKQDEERVKKLLGGI